MLELRSNGDRKTILVNSQIEEAIGIATILRVWTNIKGKGTAKNNQSQSKRGERIWEGKQLKLDLTLEGREYRWVKRGELVGSGR